ncbi:hypothetical protein D3C84_660460 [compost metagenome]
MRDRAKHLARRDLFADDHRRCRRQGKAATEHTQSPQAGLFAAVEQFKAPVQRGVQRLVPGERRLAAVGEQTKTVLQLCEQTVEAKAGHLCRRQFQGQRNAVEAPADVDRQWQLDIAQFEAVMAGHGAFDEQL